MPMSTSFFVRTLKFFGWQTVEARICKHTILMRSVQSAIPADTPQGVSVLFERLDYCYPCRARHRVSCYWCDSVINLGDRVRVFPVPEGYPVKGRHTVVFDTHEFGWPEQSVIGCVKSICEHPIKSPREHFKEGILVPVGTLMNIEIFGSTRPARCGVRLNEDPRVDHVPIRQPPRYL